MKKTDLQTWFGSRDEGPKARLDKYNCVKDVSFKNEEVVLEISPKHIEKNDKLLSFVYLPVSVLSSSIYNVYMNIDGAVDKLFIYGDSFVDMDDLIYRDIECLTENVAKKLRCSQKISVIEISAVFPSYESMLSVLDILYENIGNSQMVFILHLDISFIKDSSGTVVTLADAISEGYLPPEIVSKDSPYKVFISFDMFNDFDYEVYEVFDPMFTRYTAFEE